MNTDHTTTYSVINPTWEDDLSEGMNLGDPAHRGTVSTRIVGDLLPLPIVRSTGTADYYEAWEKVCGMLESVGVTNIRYSNVTDSVMDALHVRVEDAHGRLPYSVIIENACFISEVDGKVVASIHELELC
jgi:hypothetical protein